VPRSSSSLHPRAKVAVVAQGVERGRQDEGVSLEHGRRYPTCCRLKYEKNETYK
jgi:hypothetical protein